MTVAPKTLDEIRSQACDRLLIVLMAIGVPAVCLSLLRIIQQGWQPLMAFHICELLALTVVTLGRRHLGILVRAGTVAVILFGSGLGSVLTYGLGGGGAMYMVSSALFAACFVGRRVAYGLLVASVLSLALIYSGLRAGVIAPVLDPSDYYMHIVNWLSVIAGVIFATIIPMTAVITIHRALDAERQRADKALAVRSEFMARMSHELRTPMTGIIGMADLLSGTQLEHEQTVILGRLRDASGNLMLLLNDLLDFAKIEAGRLLIEKVPFTLSKMLTEVRDLFETAAARKGLSLTIRYPASFEDNLLGDGYRIAQVIANLVGNAIKFTEHGAVEVRIAQERDAQSTLFLQVFVKDTGIGLAADEIGRLFRPFVQADTSTSRRFGGSGLGLAICRSLIEAMDGTISVSSELGRGSTFTFTVPIAIQPPAAEVTPATTAPESPAPREPVAVTPRRLLVAEDDPMIRMLIVTMLRKKGHTVAEVEDGAAAVRTATAGPYDLLLLDMHMPVMSGPDAMRAIRLTEAATTPVVRTPIIALTADLAADHIDDFLVAGADAVMSKPIDWDALDARIAQLTAGATARLQ